MAPIKNIRDYASKNGKASTGSVWRKNTRPTEPVAWGRVNGDMLRSAIDAVTVAGGAVMFAVTSDGGAYSICVLYKDDKMREYPHTVAECEEQLQELVEYFDGKIFS